MAAQVPVNGYPSTFVKGTFLWLYADSDSIRQGTAEVEVPRGVPHPALPPDSTFAIPTGFKLCPRRRMLLILNENSQMPAVTGSSLGQRLTFAPGRIRS